MREFQSANAQIDLLEKHGFKITKNIADIPTAFMAEYGSGDLVIGYLGEFDALSGLSQVAGLTEKRI